VGKEVDVGTGMLKWDKNKATKTTFEVDQPLSNALIEVRDGSGQVIANKELGNLMPGEHKLKWDGVLKSGINANPGLYHFSVVGKSTDGQDVPIPIKSKVKITGVDLQAQGGAFFTELGKLSVKDIASVGIQGFDDAKAAIQTAEVNIPSALDDKTGSEQNSKNENAASQQQTLTSPVVDQEAAATSQEVSRDGENLIQTPSDLAGTTNTPAESDPQTAPSEASSMMNIPVTFAGK
jgi:hypothetical protein